MGLLHHNVESTPSDPNSQQKGVGKYGGTGNSSRGGEFATVITYFPDRYTATVRTERGRTIPGVPRLRSSPGDVSTLSPGTEVLISYDYGPPVIMGVLSTPASNNDGSTSFSVGDVEGVGGQGLNQSQESVGNYRNATEPSDLMPGDDVRVGKEGNMLGLLEGGIALLKSGPLSQIRTHLINDLVEVISRNFRLISDMGELNISNEDGLINLSFRGGIDQRNEAGPDEEKWTIKFDLGSEGDMLNFELTTPTGQTLFRFHVDANGKAELYGVNGIEILSGSKDGGGHAEEHTGNSNRVVDGNRSAETRGDDTREVQGNSSENIGSDKEISVGNDLKQQALRDVALSAGRNMFLRAEGGDGEAALNFDVEQGDWVTTIGSATSPNSNMKVATFAGNVEITSALGGDFKFETPLGEIETDSTQIALKTSLPSSVILGGSTLISHLVKWEELEKHLKFLYRILDGHRHMHDGSATAGGSAVAGLTGKPLIPFGALLNGSIVTFKSLKAGVSG
jgi:hypothetical protein